ncbi:MAG: alpha-ketoacid dehydrogenase subunit beta, partial [Saprospiraceae bacterium]
NSADTSLPYAPTLVDEWLPNPSKVIAAVKAVMYR